jgi:hypothetical protein
MQGSARIHDPAALAEREAVTPHTKPREFVFGAMPFRRDLQTLSKLSFLGPRGVGWAGGMPPSSSSSDDGPHQAASPPVPGLQYSPRPSTFCVCCRAAEQVVSRLAPLSSAWSCFREDPVGGLHPLGAQALVLYSLPVVSTIRPFDCQFGPWYMI